MTPVVQVLVHLGHLVTGVVEDLMVRCIRWLVKKKEIICLSLVKIGRRTYRLLYIYAIVGAVHISFRYGVADKSWLISIVFHALLLSHWF